MSSAANWPTGVPGPRLAGYSYSPVDGTIRTGITLGKLRARQRFGSVSARLSIQLVLTSAELKIFEEWYRDDLRLGTASFWVNIRVGIGLIPHECRFMGAYTRTLHRNDFHRIASQLFIKKIAAYDSDTLDVIDMFGGPDPYNEFLDLFETFINHDLPNSEMSAES